MTQRQNMELDDARKSDTDTDSYVSIEQYMMQGAEYRIMEEPSPELALEGTGELVDSFVWPPRVLEDQPLSLIMQQLRDPVIQPGSLGAVSPGVASIMSPASTAPEQITFEPAISPEDTALVAEMDANSLELFSSHWHARIMRARSAASWTLQRRTPIGPPVCMTSPSMALGGPETDKAYRHAIGYDCAEVTHAS